MHETIELSPKQFTSCKRSGLKSEAPTYRVVGPPNLGTWGPSIVSSPITSSWVSITNGTSTNGVH